MNTMKFEQAVFLQENADEIAQIKQAWDRMAGSVISNTLVQITNPELIERVVEVGEFIYNDDITPTSLRLIKSTMLEVTEYLHSEDFAVADTAIRTVARLMRQSRRRNKK